jgi:hypothetical protein
MDALCSKLEILSERLSRSIEALNSASRIQQPVTHGGDYVRAEESCTDVQLSSQAADRTHIAIPDLPQSSEEQGDAAEGTDDYEVGNQAADELDPDSDSDQES